MFSFPSQNGVTPLFAASQSNHGGIVTLLLNASALVDLARNVSSFLLLSNSCYYYQRIVLLQKYGGIFLVVTWSNGQPP